MRKNSAVIAGLAAGLTLLAAADAASAQAAAARSRAPSVSLSEAQAARAATGTGQSRLRFTERGRWGLDLNLSQPVGRDSNLGDVEAGAYYRVNPRLRVGATAEPEADPARPPQTDRRTAPRFRLESIFRF